MRPRTPARLATAAAVAAGILLPTAAVADEAAPELPDAALARADALAADLDVDSPWREALESAIDPDDYACGATDFDAWIDAELAAIDLDVLITIDQYAATIWPTYYKLLFDDDASDERIGVDGEFTQEQRKRHRDNQRFWDVETDDVLLQGMHGADIADDAKMVPTVQWLFGVDEALATSVVDFVQAQIEAEPTITYDNPLFTLNAFAFSADGPIPGVGIVPDRIVMGDGVLEMLVETGLGDVGPDFVHAHEFAHHVQFEIGAFDSDLPAPEATRRTELMADGFAAYYLRHARGASMQRKRIVDASASAYTVGDCAYTDPGHHGTPNQRAAAAQWGIDLAEGAQPQGAILPAEEMLARFEAVLPTLLLPDAG